MTSQETSLTAVDTFPAGPEPLPGEICEQYIRCGKSGCRCEQGERHGPYYYRIWREGDHVHKVYVKRAELAAMQQACEAHRFQRRLLRDAQQERERLARHIMQEQRRTVHLRRRMPHTA